VAFELIGSRRDVIEVASRDSGTALVLLHKKLTFQASEEDEEVLVWNLDCVHLAIT
jgi:hypothetical protein